MILGRAGTANNVRACAHMCVPSFFHAHPSVAHVRARIYPSPSRVCTSTDCLSRTTLPIDAALPHPLDPSSNPLVAWLNLLRARLLFRAVETRANPFSFHELRRAESHVLLLERPSRFFQLAAPIPHPLPPARTPREKCFCSFRGRCPSSSWCSAVDERVEESLPISPRVFLFFFKVDSTQKDFGEISEFLEKSKGLLNNFLIDELKNFRDWCWARRNLLVLRNEDSQELKVSILKLDKNHERFHIPNNS